MAGQVINGGDLMLFIDDKSIAFATSHKLSINDRAYKQGMRRDTV